MKRTRTCRGQAITETFVTLPIYLTLAFLAMQICQLGVALLMTNYGASSIARKIAREESTGLETSIGQTSSNIQTVATHPVPDLRAWGSDYGTQLNKLMVAGMSFNGLSGCILTEGVTPTLTVNASAAVPAFPLVGVFLNKALNSNYDGGDIDGNPCIEQIQKSLGSIAFKSSTTGGFQFIVYGRASVRLNLKG